MLRHQNQQLNDDKSERQTTPTLAEPVDIFLTHVPANLRAKFGTARCRSLLADQEKVQLAWSRLLADDGSPNRQTTPKRLPPIRDENRQQQQPQQTDCSATLSEQFNSNYSPGVTATRRLGHSRETHGGDVFTRDAGAYNADNLSRPHRLRKDEFSAYNEIIHVERKFNNQWRNQPGQNQQAAPPKLTKPQPAPVKTQQLQQQQPEPSASILSQNSGKSNAAKRVTIEEQQRSKAPGPADQLHRANTVQRGDD